MKIPWLDIRRQNKLVKEEFLKKVGEILDSGQICMGKLCEEFEQKWAEKSGAKYCLLLSSGTDALTLTIDALGIKGPVLTPSVSFIATPNAITLNRNPVIFCETDKNGNISILEALSKLSVQQLMNPVKGILAVAMYGNPPDLENLQRLSREYNIPLICDGAQAHLSKINGKPLTDYCDVVCESFYISKNIGALTEAGCILTNNESLYNIIKSLRNHGRGASNYEFNDIGYNCRPSELTAASLLCKFPFIDQWTERRIELAQKYNELLKPLKDEGKLDYLEPAANVKCVYHLYPILVKNRGEIRKRLLELGVETQMQYNKALHLQPCYKDLKQGPFPVAETICDQVITLPLNDQLTDEECQYVINVVKMTML